MIFIDFPALCLSVFSWKMSCLECPITVGLRVLWPGKCVLDVVAWDVVAGGGMEHQKQDQIFVHFEVLKLFEVRVC